jgi:hypothetical protein
MIRISAVMIEITRTMVAYGIIAVIVAVAIPLAIKIRIRRQREQLRRRGIKRNGH